MPLADTGRRLNRFFRMSPRFELAGQEVRVRIPSAPEDRPRDFGVEVYRWRALTPPAPSLPSLTPARRERGGVKRLALKPSPSSPGGRA